MKEATASALENFCRDTIRVLRERNIATKSDVNTLTEDLDVLIDALAQEDIKP
jgi:hypothetical protein